MRGFSAESVCNMPLKDLSYVTMLPLERKTSEVISRAYDRDLGRRTCRFRGNTTKIITSRCTGGGKAFREKQYARHAKMDVRLLMPGGNLHL
jgi:hypothetical protein